MLKELNFEDLKQTRISEPGATFYIASRGWLDYVKFDLIK